MFQIQHIIIFSTLSLLTLSLTFLYTPHIFPLYPHPRQHPIPLSDELDDFTLFTRAANSHPTPIRLGSHSKAPPPLKIAFLFLTNTDLFLAPLWAHFFNTSPSPHLYNIYIHVDPRTRFTDPGGVFSGRQIPSKKTERSSATLISAAKRLLANAVLDDPLNYYFALLSQSCVPLHSFPYTYQTLLPPSRPARPARPMSRVSYIEILANETTLPSRYVARGSKVMLPEVSFSKFRVGSQFFVLNRKHAVLVLRERKLWRKFRLPCYRVESCYPEEHYFATYLHMVDPAGCSKYTLTRVNWTDMVDGHPHTYGPQEVSAELIYTLRKSNFSEGYLFARKFGKESLEPLMEIADSVIFKD